MAHFLQKYSQYLATAGVCSAFASSLLPQTLGLNYYKSQLANYKNEVIQPVEEHVQGLLEKVRTMCQFGKYPNMYLCATATCLDNKDLCLGNYIKAYAMI